MIISRYLIKEVCYALLAITCVLLLVFLSNQLVRFLSYAASGKIAANVLFQIMGFEVAFLLAILLPLGLYLGIISTYGRLYADNELRVIQAAGFSTQKLSQLTVGLALVVMVVVMMLTLWINPYIAQAKDKLVSGGAAAGNVINNLIPGRFQLSGDENRVLYVERIGRDHQRARNIFVAEQRKAAADGTGNPWTVLSAAEGYQMTDPVSKDKFVVAVDGYRYEGTPGQNAYKIIQFKKYAIRLPDQGIQMQHQAQEVIPTSTLWQNYFINPRNAAELQWRISMPLSVLLLALLAIPLSNVRPRQSRYAQLLPAILIYVIYVELLFVARDWVEQKTLPISLGLWWVHALLILVIALLFLWQTSHWILKKEIIMQLLQRYIAKGVLISTALVFLVVVGLSFIVGLLKELHDIGVGEYGFGHAVLYVLLQLPHTLYQFSPLLVLLGGVLGLGLLMASHELMVMRTAGASVPQIVWGVISAALLMIIVMTMMGELMGPRAEYLAEKRKSSAMSNGQAVATQSGIWIHEGNNFLHVEHIVGRNHLEGVTRYEFDDAHHLLAAYYAKTLDFINDQWVLHDVAKTSLKNDRTQSEQLTEATWNLNLTPNLLNVGIMEPESMSLLKLHEYAHSLDKNHLQASSFKLEFWQRVFQPLAILVMILLAVPFVFAAPRSINIGRRILLAIIVGFAFYILAALLGQFSIVFQFPPFIAALLPILLFAGVGYALMIKLN